ncbi:MULTISPECIES: hypothetical protein [Bacillus]|uniref:hypothetical protein n=1 Tax=Bacillus TaxID=1386 RepID=UPI001582280B|nr:hypothetical protein [Bacillus glycinifermentans]MBU8785863.1 hypothetical protein [Bacillus glycinifermentans]NUJ15601.1 hypothetical protein [Bacillus glycinifermentans]
MQVIKAYTRLISFYEKLSGSQAEQRFQYREAGLETAAVGRFIILAAPQKALEPFFGNKSNLDSRFCRGV